MQSRVQLAESSKIAINWGGMKIATGLLRDDGTIMILRMEDRFRHVASNIHAAGPGIEKQRVKKPAEALNIVTALIYHESTDRLYASNLYALRGAIHFQMGNYVQALADEKQANGIFPIYTTLGFEAEVLAAMGRHAEAAEKFMEAWHGMYKIPEYAEGAAIEMAKAGDIMGALERYNLPGSQVTEYRGVYYNEENAERMKVAVEKLLKKASPAQIQKLAEGMSSRAPSFVARIIIEQQKLHRKPAPTSMDLSQVF